MVRIFLTQIARTGRVPLELDANADEAVAGAWSECAGTLESFFDPTKSW